MGQRDELKTQFMTREGLYKLMTLSEYSRPNRFVLWKASSKLIAFKKLLQVMCQIECRNTET